MVFISSLWQDDHKDMIYFTLRIYSPRGFFNYRFLNTKVSIQRMILFSKEYEFNYYDLRSFIILYVSIDDHLLVLTRGFPLNPDSSQNSLYLEIYGNC